MTVSFNLSDIGIPNSGNASDYFILQDDDTNFTNATTHNTGVNISGDVLTFTNVSFTDGHYFSVGFIELLVAPGDVFSGIVGWYRGDSEELSNTEGGVMSTWNNLASINNATPQGLSDLPTYQESIHNFNSSVYFANGDNGYFNIDLDDINDSDYNIIAIVERDDSSSDNYFLGTNSSTANQGLHLGYIDDTTLNFDQSSNGVTVSVNNFNNPATSKVLIRSQLDGSSGKIIQELRDGSFAQNSDAVMNYLTGDNQGVLGRGNGIDGFNGYVSEVILYNNTLTNSELNKIYSYLAIKYGMTLDATDGITNGDYQDSDTNVIWDESENTTYHYNVFGIGRDAISDLNQTKSHEDTTIDLTIEKTDVFSTDKSFVMIGNDNGSETLTTADTHYNYTNRVTRTWKSQISGNPGSVNISFNIGGATGITNTGNTIDYALLIDTDTDFSNATKQINEVSISGDIVTFGNVILNDGDIFTLATDFIEYGPGDVKTDLTLWLKANEGTNTTINGSGITSWLDQATQGNHATGTGIPQFKENAFNNNPSIEFFNTAFPIQGEITRDNGVNSTIFFVQKSNSSITNNEAFGDFYNSGASRRQYFFDKGYGNSDESYTIQEDKVTFLMVDDLGVNSTADVYENGLFLAASSKNPNTEWTGLGAYQIGDDQTGGDEFTGEIAEVLYYDRELTSLERKKVETYLAIKYGITLDNSGGGTDGDYAISDGVTVWDASENSATYHNDVFGIGRDDNSVLNQLKSRSENSDSFITIEKTSSFTNDKDVIIIGNDDAAIEASVSNPSPSYSQRINRVWNVQVNGTPGDVSVSFHINDQTTYGNPVSDYALLIDTDADFSSGATEHTTGASLVGGILTFTNVSLSDDNFITLAVENPVTPYPGAVGTDLSLWLRSDLATNSIVDGTGVTFWGDQSGNGADATGTGNATYDYSEMINYNPSIRFTSDVQPFTGEITRPNGAGSTVFVVSHIEDIDDIDNQNADRVTLVEFNDRDNGGNSERQIFFSDEYFNNINSNYTKEVPNLYTAKDTDGTSTVEIFENNTLTGSGNLSLNSHNTEWTTADYFIGDDQTGGDELTGRISEIIYYDTALSTGDIQRVETYLAIKYGITLSGDYVSSANGVLWGTGTNATYRNDIAMIGQDKNSSLYQKQSKSESEDGILTISLGTTVATNNIANTNEFDDNLDFLMWGNNSSDNIVSLVDNGVASGTICKTINKRLDRDWKIINIGSVGAVTLSFDLSTLPDPSDYTLNIDIDGDGDYATGTVNTHTGVVDGDNLVFSNLTLADGVVFTLTKNTVTAEIVYYNGTWSGGSGIDGALGSTDTAKSVRVLSDVTISENSSCDCIDIDSGFIVTVASENYLQVANTLKLDGDIYLEGTSELIQTTASTTTGTGTLRKIIGEATESEYRYNYLSSPVNTSGTYSLSGNMKFNTGATLADNTDPTFTDGYEGSGTELSRFWMYTLDGTEYTQINENTSLNSGIGFTMKGTGTANNYNFIGTPNNGSITALNITTSEYAMLGNPYPSAIGADEFNSDMSASNITDGTIYLWDQPNGANHSQEQSHGGYATINSSGKVAAGITGASTPTNFIKPGQGFIVTGGTSGGNIVFENSMRISNTSSSSAHLFKASNYNEANPEIRLGFEFDEEGTNHRQLLVVPNGGDLAHEQGKDALMFDNNVNDAYLLVEDKESRYVITSVPYIDEDLELPIGVVVDSDKEVTFNLDALENVSKDVYILDKENATFTNLSGNSTYKTTISTGDYQNRFSLMFRESGALDNDLLEKSETSIYVENNILIVVLEKGIVNEVDLYDFTGKKMISKSNEDISNNINVDVSSLLSQIYIVKIKTDNGTITKKVVVD